MRGGEGIFIFDEVEGSRRRPKEGRESSMSHRGSVPGIRGRLAGVFAGVMLTLWWGRCALGEEAGGGETSQGNALVSWLVFGIFGMIALYLVFKGTRTK